MKISPGTVEIYTSGAFDDDGPNVGKLTQVNDDAIATAGALRQQAPDRYKTLVSGVPIRLA